MTAAAPFAPLSPSKASRFYGACRTRKRSVAGRSARTARVKGRERIRSSIIKRRSGTSAGRKGRVRWVKSERNDETQTSRIFHGNVKQRGRERERERERERRSRGGNARFDKSISAQLQRAESVCILIKCAIHTTMRTISTISAISPVTRATRPVLEHCFRSEPC